ncbi:MAG: excinuclease ABC subunit UvrA [Proteobacteria bacterium]|nr:excinuclease ABC subunit UvrA [Pseudomonadota bacterium]
MKDNRIIIRGAREHNLKNVDVDIPRDRLVVVTGLSGSGKSTLAFDTLYAEGQRRYVESLSTYARQFLERMDKPDVDTIEGLSPAIAIEQKSASHNPRSTVGTVTEVYDYLRLLFARVGQPHCYECGLPIESQSVDQIVDQILELPEGTRALILAPLASEKKGAHEKLFARLIREGFARVKVDGQVHELESVPTLAKTKKHDISVVVDRLVVKPGVRKRLADSLELAMAQGGGFVTVETPGAGEPILFSEKSACIRCKISYPELAPASFSFNSPQGACGKCDGLGSSMEFDPALVVPNPRLSLREGAVAPWANRNSVHFMEFLDAITSHYRQDIHTPFEELSPHFQNVILSGSGKDSIPFYFERRGKRFTYQKPFEGIIPKLSRRYHETSSQWSREEIEQYMNFRPCAECGGTRLRKESRSVTVGALAIHEVTALSVDRCLNFFSGLSLSPRNQTVAGRILKEINERLGFLKNVGLGYLTLGRTAATLSGGEAQRIRLATQIGSKLTGVLYVLDEPSIGLHQRDNRRLLDTLISMRDLGNTVLVVEHDAETILAADHVVDMGPGAGMAGGEVVFSGPPEEMLRHEKSLTGQYLSGRKRIQIPERRRNEDRGNLVVEGATANNLKDVTAAFPLGRLVCVTGVSGSGKSSLVIETLYRGLTQHLSRTRTAAGPCQGFRGLSLVDKVIHIDQAPIGRTPRSNPSTYTGLFTPIRDLFSRTPDARVRGYKPGRFSFNVRGGRCEACAGDGILKIEMHFLPDVYVSCDVCHGKRYNRESLEIRYKGKNIAEILDMTVNQASRFFDKIESIRSKLVTLVDVGLGYVKMGQAATTLSGGEAQRIKLARELSKRGTGRTVYILDEPTTGLHFADIQKLLEVLNRLVDNGNTVVVIEHNMDVIKSADYLIDLGPEGGDEGGFVVGAGTPEEIAALPGSHTGRYLAEVLDREGRAA